MRRSATERYGVQVYWSDADQATSPRFQKSPVISGFGDTEEQALAELREVLPAVVDVYLETGRPTESAFPNLLDLEREASHPEGAPRGP
jgi:predicted RNase H-like HicB family nuclease